MISILHPSRGRAKQSFNTISKWLHLASTEIELIVSIDNDDPQFNEYVQIYVNPFVSDSRSAVQAINNAAKVAQGDILMVVSDDTDCFPDWDTALLKEVEGKTDWILKTQDGIQPWIITMPVMDRTYFNRTGRIYDPDFKHMFCDTWLTIQADISGRKLTSNLMFRHLNDTIKDAVRERSDATWLEGERTIIHKIKSTPVEYLNKIDDRGMKNWIRNKTGIRV